VVGGGHFLLAFITIRLQCSSAAFLTFFSFFLHLFYIMKKVNLKFSKWFGEAGEEEGGSV